MPLLQSERRIRTTQFATKWGLQNPRIVKPIDRSLNITFKAPGDLEAAQGRIDAVQRAKLESEKRHGISKIFTSKPKASKYKAREITAALQSVVQIDGPSGVVEVLLELLLQHDGDVNITKKSTNPWKRMAKVDQENIRTGLLPIATRVGNINTIQLLLPKADDISLNESLSIALNAAPLSRNLDIIELLLAYGADASLYAGFFNSAVRNSDRDLVGLLLSAPKRISISTMTDALYAAVETGALEMAYILAQTNADADADNGKVLRQAISTARHELVTIMTLCFCPPSQDNLDEAVPFIFSSLTTSNHQKKELLEALLFGGATGSRAAPVLLELVKQCTIRNAASDFAVEASTNTVVTMIICLIHASTSLDYENAAALKTVVSSSRTNLIDIFLSSKNFNERLASIAFSSIDLNAIPDVRVTIASKLLAKGASGTPLHDALIYAVKTDHIEAINLLLAGNGFSKASVDYQDAAAIKDALSREKIQIVKLLLGSGSPQISLASSVFPYVWLCSKEGRLVLAQELLNHGAAGVNVNDGLVLALEDRGPNRDHRLIKLLARGRADLGFENGRALELATTFFDMTALEMLLAENPLPKYLNAAFASAMALRPVENRFVACDMLLKAGAKGKGVNEALTIAVLEESSDTSFLKILIPNANINHNEGHALSEAIKRNHGNHASLLLEQHPRLDATSFMNAFDAAFSHTEPAEEFKYCRMILEASPPKISTSTALLKAVKKACSEDLCRLFLQHKTNLNYDGGIFLVTAVYGQNIKILTLFVENTNPKPSKNSLEAAFDATFRANDETCRLAMAQILLDAGVKGDPLHAALIAQVKRGDMNVTLCSMLLKYGASINAQNGEALVIAAKLGATVLLQTMLQGQKATYSSLSRAFKSADYDRIDLVKIFLEAGLTGDPLHYALATQANRGNDTLPVCTLLLAHGASGDEYNGEALVRAAKLAALPLLQAIIQRKVSDASLARAFKSADHQNIDLIKIFLDAGLKGEPLHTALVEQSKRGNKGLAICALLLTHGASVNEYNGEALTTAAKLEALPLLEAMLKDKVASKATLNRAFKSTNHENLDIVKIFLDVGLAGEPLDTALVEQSKRGNAATAICTMLLTHGASVDANHGEALNNAAKLGASLLLQALLSKRSAADATLTQAFKSADNENVDLVKIFLDAGLKGEPVHSALIEQSRRGNDALVVCTLLVTHGASIDASNGEALANAARLSAISLLRMMFQGQDILNVSLTWAFKAADHTQYEIVELFLKAGLHGEALDSALVIQAQRGIEGLAICELLLKYGADINEYDGKALNEAVASGNVVLMQAMLNGRKATPKTLSQGFESALQLHDQLRLVMIQLLIDAGLQPGRQIDIGLLDLVQSGSKDIDSMRELLTLGASVHHDNHSALDVAAQLCHHDVLLLLLEYLTEISAASLVFGDRLQESWSTLTKEMVDTLEILLQHGAKGEDVQKALVLAISESDTNPLAYSFASILLNHDVDVNYEQGRPLQIAAEIAALDFLSIMIAKGATSESLVMAFPHIFKVQPQANEDTMLSLIKLFREHAGEQLSSAVHPTIPDAPVFMSVYNYPERPRVLEAVLDAGFSVDQKMLHHVLDIGSIEITPLYWALLEHKKVVTESVVYMLLKRGASVQGHPTPLLHLAIRKGYSSVVQLLIEAGADVDCANAENETPLLLAYQSGDLSTMKALLRAECESDDGTLHDAARRLDFKVIELLLEHDHDPNRPSLEHEGRTALAELVFHAPVFAKRNSDKNLERDAKKAIKLMAKEGARTNIQIKTADDTDKSLLLLAIDSQNPLVMTKALLDADQWKFVNDDFNLYNDGQYTYSPAMYVEKGVWAGDAVQARYVLNLLKSFQVKRRFWKNQGDQPEDMLDAPPEIMAAENARKAALAKTLREEVEKQARLAEIEAKRSAKMIEIEAEAHAEYTRRLNKAKLERALAHEDNEAELDAQARTREFEIKYQENLIELEQKKEQVAIDQQLRKQKGLADIQMKLQSQTNEQTLRVLEEKRKNLQEKGKAGYMVMDVYEGMQRAGLGVVSSGKGYGGGGGNSRAAIRGPSVRKAIQNEHVSDSDSD